MPFLRSSTSQPGFTPSPEHRACDDAELIQLIAAGGEGARAAAAEFLFRNQALIRRRIRNKLNASARRLFDSEDLFSTLARRVDQEVEKRRYPILDERQFWGLINRIGDNCITDIAREVKLQRRATDGPLRSALLGRKWVADRNQADSHKELLADAQKAVAPGSDSQIFLLRLLGYPFATIGEALGLSEPAARKRWCRIRRNLRERFGRTGST